MKIKPTLMIRFSGLYLVTVCLALIVCRGAAANAASFATNWQGGERVQMRVIAGDAEWLGQNEIFAGIEIRLAPKWKTYWRSPGDTGIPPEFDWSGSENLRQAKVLYPVPFRFKDPGGMSIGYKSRVTLPVLLKPIDPDKPIMLKLNAAYAICYDLCVPVQSSYSMLIDGSGQSPFGPVLSLALADIPKPMGPQSGVGVQSVRFVDGAAKALIIKVRTQQPQVPVELFVEGAEGAYVPHPKRLEQSDDQAFVTYRINLEDVDDPLSFKTMRMKCTLKVGGEPIVQPCFVR